MPFSYEKEGRFRKVVKAQQLWYAIIESQTETGTPYMLYKDSCNRKSNQQNLGTIKCSNLCTEIVEYTSKDEVGRKTSASGTERRILRSLWIICDSLTWFPLSWVKGVFVACCKQKGTKIEIIKEEVWCVPLNIF